MVSHQKGVSACMLHAFLLHASLTSVNGGWIQDLMGALGELPWGEFRRDIAGNVASHKGRGNGQSAWDIAVEKQNDAITQLEKWKEAEEEGEVAAQQAAWEHAEAKRQLYEAQQHWMHAKEWNRQAAAQDAAWRHSEADRRLQVAQQAWERALDKKEEALEQQDSWEYEVATQELAKQKAAREDAIARQKEAREQQQEWRKEEEKHRQAEQQAWLEFAKAERWLEELSQEQHEDTGQHAAWRQQQAAAQRSSWEQQRAAQRSAAQQQRAALQAFAEAKAPILDNRMSVAEIREFIKQAGGAEQLSSYGESVEQLLGLAKSYVRAWEVRRLVAAKESLSEKAAFVAAIFRCDPAQVQARAVTQTTVSSVYKELRLKVHPDKNREEDAHLAKVAFQSLQEAWGSLPEVHSEL
ncbi:hypothetical protein DUNSADRAFT_8515 [Dunaliella salina]|uniref:J domain-containing protein n=1 Tax=Dunaliella salina TaxID=3046 RepID=A0ABQ7GJA1_DUNSA|nr:hypothetical protein DUNSADRAFT_8515 [Dunaliella salina]|eukprot:KAF5834688.1 hypothetical protein DUNSADRAFT_8515 [Dunaliella salina]